MPSGAKKRKAAKKKMRKETHDVINHSGAQSQVGNDDPNSLNGRESDGGEFERGEEEAKKEIVGAKDVGNLQEEDYVDISKETKQSEDISALEEENGNGESRESRSSSSSSSSSDDEEVAVGEDKSVVVNSEESRIQVENDRREEIVKPSDYLPEGLAAGAGGASVEVYNVVEERIPAVESVQQVFPVLQEANFSTITVSIENPVGSNVIDLALKDKEVEASPQSSSENENISSAVMDLPPEKVEYKEILVDDLTSANSSPMMGLTENESEDKLPKSSDRPAVKTSREMNNGKYLNKQAEDEVDSPVVHAKNGEEHVKGMEAYEHSDDHPLITSTPLPVRRTSWTGCCGLFEVFAGSTR